MSRAQISDNCSLFLSDFLRKSLLVSGIHLHCAGTILGDQVGVSPMELTLGFLRGARQVLARTLWWLKAGHYHS